MEMVSIPEAAALLLLVGVQARGSKPTPVGLDGTKRGRVSRTRGLRSTASAGRRGRAHG
jgi:hypothetical protein